MMTEQNRYLSIVYPHNQRLMSGKAHDIVIMRTCHAVAQQGHQIKIITGKPSGTDTVYDFYGLKPLPEFEIIQVPMLRGRHFSWHGVFNLFCLLKILYLKGKGQADVIYLREIKLAQFLLQFKKLIGLPFVIEVHDLKINKFYDSCPVKDKGEDVVFRKVDAIVVLLTSFGKILKETYNISGIPVIKAPLAAEKIRFPINSDNNGGKTIGYIGQLYPMQGVDILIEAIRYIPDARLSIIGGNEKDLNRLKHLASNLNLDKRIDFHGFVHPHRVSEIAKDIDVMVICALDRGKRRYAAHTKLYEYMAMGKPIVAVDLPSIREEVTDGKDILLVKPEDPKGLAEKIGYLLYNPDVARQLAVNAYRSADEFSWAKRAARLSEVFAMVYEKNREKNIKEEEIKIRTGPAGSLVLFFYGPYDVSWLRERIIDLTKGRGGRHVKSSQFAAVIRFENPLTGEAFYYKEFLNRGFKDLIKNLVGLTRSKRAFTAGHQLLKFGVPTPEPVLRGVVRTFFFIRKNFMITKAVAGDRTYEYFKHRYKLPLPPELLEEKRAFIYTAGREVGRLHRAGIFHGDLRVGNLIIEGYGPAAKIYFVDNERTMHYGILSAGKRLKNLIQLNMVGLQHITSTDRLRFLNAYLRENLELMPHKKELINDVVRMTQKRRQPKNSR